MGILLLAGHSTACWAFYCLPGILLLARRSTACRTFYCLVGILLLAGRSTACRTFYCLVGILLLAEHSTACWAFYCLPGVLLLAGHSTACLAFYCFSDIPSCLITYTGLTLPGLRHKVFSRLQVLPLQRRVLVLDLLLLLRSVRFCWFAMASTLSHIFRFNSEHNSCTVCLFGHTHKPCTCRYTGSTAVASLTANSSICQRFLRCFVPFLPCQPLFIIEDSNDEDGINCSPENDRTFARHNHLTNTSTTCWAFYCLLGNLLLAGHCTACWAFYCLLGILLLL